MADNVTLPAAGAVIATDEIGGKHHKIVKAAFGPDGSATLVSPSDGLPVAVVGQAAVTGPLTDAELRATPVAMSVSGTAAISSTDLGARADAAATDDSGAFSVIAFIKRGLANWTSLLARIPTLVSGRMPVEAVGAAADGAAVAGNPLLFGGSDGVFARALRVDQAGRLFTAAPEVTGSISALNGTVELDVRGCGGVLVDVRNAYVGTVSFQFTYDGAVWFAAVGIQVGAVAGSTYSSSTSGVGVFMLTCTGVRSVRAIATAWTSGSAAIVLRGVQAAPNVSASLIGTAAIGASTNLIGDVGLQARANATGAGTPVAINCPATPAAQSLKASAGRLLMMKLRNSSASTRFVKLFNVSGAVTMGTTSALLDYPIPAGGELSIETDLGIAFTTGLQVAITGAVGLTNNTAITAGDVVGFATFA